MAKGDVITPVRIPEKLAAKLDSEVKRDKRSRNFVINQALEYWLRRKSRDNQEAAKSS